MSDERMKWMTVSMYRNIAGRGSRMCLGPEAGKRQALTRNCKDSRVRVTGTEGESGRHVIGPLTRVSPLPVQPS